MTALCGLALAELQAFCQAQGQPKFRAQQLAEWVYRKRALGFDAMTNLPKSWRGQLAADAVVAPGQVRGTQVSSDGATKLLIGLADGETVETVLIPDAERRTVCVSTQVGCAMGCAFCASGVNGLERDLTAAEIVGQLLLAQSLLPQRERLSNVVYMGMGEPLANYDAVLKSVRIVNAEWGLGIGARKITISTVGLPAMIRRLAGEPLQFTLAISLHSADDAKRRELLPVAGRIPLDDVFAAARDFFARTGREVTFEYALLAGVNCSVRDAERLADRLAGLRCNVNVISFNRVEGKAFVPPSAAEADAFARALEALGVNVTVRRRRGADVDAACGQLRNREAGE